MINELLTINYNSIEYQDAMKLHTQILTSGSVAASALVDMCQSMKKMRDSRQYIHLGYHDFDEYVVSACRMKARQAYTYISTIERLGESALQSNANLGITKLALLASVSDAQREDIMENNDVDDMSTRELQALTEQLTKAQEQISLLTEETSMAAKTNAVYMDEIMNAERAKEAAQEELRKYKEDEYLPIISEIDLEALKAEKQDALSAAVKATAEKEQAVAEAIKTTEKAWKEKVAATKEKAIADSKKDAENQIEQARQDGIKAGQEAAKVGLEAVEKEKADALARAQALEKQLSVASNPDTVIFMHIFNELQNNYEKLLACGKSITDKDPANGDKFAGAIHKFVLNIMPGMLPKIQEPIKKIQSCRVCGCTEDHACQGGCYWVERDLCSQCAEVGERE